MSTLPRPATDGSVGLLAGAAVVLVGNLVPLFGVVELGWGLTALLVVYWLESGLVGVLTVPRILVAGIDAPLDDLPSAERNTGDAQFFVFHYGLFWFVHGVFVAVFVLWLGVPTLPGLTAIVLGAGSLLVAHLGATADYLLNDHYRLSNPDAEFFRPYPRVMALHFTIVFGSIGVAVLGSPLVLIVILVGVKTVADLLAFAYDRSKARNTGVTPRP